MAKKDYESIGGYPSPFVKDSEKSKKEYGLAYFKRMYADWAGQNEVQFAERRRRYQTSRKYAAGSQDVGKYKDLLDVKGDASYLNLDWTPVSIIPKFVDIIVGGLVNQDFEYKAEAIDTVAKQKKLQERYRLMIEMLDKDFFKKLEEIHGVSLNSQGFIPNDNEELDLYMNMDYKDAIEIAMEQALKLVMTKNDDEIIRERLLRDLVTLNIASIKVNTTHEGIKVRYVDPENLIYSYSDRPDFKQIQHAGEIYQVTIGELKRMAGDEFSEEEYKEIASQYLGKNGNPYRLTKQDYVDDSTGLRIMEYDKFAITIMDAEFLSYNKSIYEKKETEFGGTVVRKRDENYKKPKNSKLKREKIERPYKVAYKGKLIVGTDMLFDYGLCSNMIRPKDNLTETTLSYIIFSPNRYKGVEKSLVDRMIPFADQIQLTHLKLQQLIGKARPPGIAFELGALENVSKGDGGTFTPLELQEIYDQTGNLYYRMQDDTGAATGQRPIQELPNGIGRDMMSLVQIYQYNLQMIRDVTGMNEARDGSLPDKEALVGTQKLALMASNNATRHLNNAYFNILKRCCEHIVSRVQDVTNYTPELSNSFFSALGDGSRVAVEILGDVHIHDFGIFIDVAPNEEEKMQLEQSIQIALQKNEIRIEDVMMIRQLKNIKLASQLMTLRRKKYMEEQAQMAQKNAEANQQVQMQAAQMAQQMKMQELQAEAQMVQVKEQAKLRTSIETMRAKAQIDEMVADREHMRQMERISLNNEGKAKVQKTEEQLKKETQKQVAFTQSHLVEQRKDRVGTLPEPMD